MQQINGFQFTLEKRDHLNLSDNRQSRYQEKERSEGGQPDSFTFESIIHDMDENEQNLIF